jgi:hypothetical protein
LIRCHRLPEPLLRLFYSFSGQNCLRQMTATTGRKLITALHITNSFRQLREPQRPFHWGISSNPRCSHNDIWMLQLNLRIETKMNSSFCNLYIYIYIYIIVKESICFVRCENKASKNSQLCMGCSILSSNIQDINLLSLLFLFLVTSQAGNNVFFAPFLDQCPFFLS